MNNELILQRENFIEEYSENFDNYTLIEIADKTYAIKTQEVMEIVKVIELEFQCNLPTCVLGILRFENKPVGVIDLREVQKKDRIVYDLSSKIVIIQTNECITSIICDKVIDIKRLKKENIHTLPFNSAMEFYDGIHVKDNKNIYILNMDNLLGYIKKNSSRYVNENPKELFLVNDEESRAILQERKNFLIKETQELQTTKALYDMGVSFVINDVKYYINMASVKEFHKINNLKFIKIPSTPDYIFGLINIKGEYITILDIRKFFNNSKTELKEKSTLIILNSNEYKIGILADEICESMNVDFEEIIQNRLQKEDNKMMEFVKDGEIYQVLDVEKLLQDDRLTIA